MLPGPLIGFAQPVGPCGTRAPCGISRHDSAHKNGPAQCFCTCIGIDRYTDRRHEMATIVGSRPAKYVELGGGLPALAITVNAENARRVSCPESLTEAVATKCAHLYWT